MTAVVRLLAAWFLLTISGCVTPGQHYGRAADELAFSRKIVTGQSFTHVVWSNDIPRASRSTLHVYIEGDGSPWVAGVPAADPAPRQPMALHLMAVDAAPAVLVGRPCYHVNKQPGNCGVRQWTEARYSKTIVASMASAIEQLRIDGGYRSVVLIGYSGGGVLATLIANTIEPVDAVITVGANLDTSAWTAHHGYTSLAASENPADSLPPANHAVYVHYIGRNDAVVPSATRDAYFANHAYARDIVVDDFGHVCCWKNDWSRLLSEALVLIETVR